MSEIMRSESFYLEMVSLTDPGRVRALNEDAVAVDRQHGFAVVADEVRKLAERTAISTREITGTIESMRCSASESVRKIEGTVEKVSNGVDKAQEASVAIKEIGEESRGTQDMVSEISNAISEQSSATRSIAVEIERIARMSEQSAAAADESARAAGDLDFLAREFQGIIATYRM